MAAFTLAAILLATTSCGSPRGNLHLGGRTLLTYESSGASADAALSGVLHVNSAGCLAVGDEVLVVPVGSELKRDGSMVVFGQTYKFGSKIKLGGGGGGKQPIGAACGKVVDYWYV